MYNFLRAVGGAVSDLVNPAGLPVLPMLAIAVLLVSMAGLLLQ
jgi:hypothetical protein